jgi:hypothetical protein
MEMVAEDVLMTVDSAGGYLKPTQVPDDLIENAQVVARIEVPVLKEAYQRIGERKTDDQKQQSDSM